MKYESKINDDEKNALVRILEHVKSVWEGNEGIPAYFTIHDHTHSEGVVRAIDKLLPIDKFEPKEIFYIIASALLHDIGMIPDLQGLEPVTSENARIHHHLRTEQYILKKYKDIGIKKYDDAIIIGKICRYHRRKEDIRQCTPIHHEIRIQLLASYLRLADSIHINRERARENLFKIFIDTGIPVTSKFHWIRSYCTEEVCPNCNKNSIEIKLYAKKDDVDGIEMICKSIEDDIKSEIFKIKDVLIAHNMPHYSNVYTSYGLGTPPHQKIYIKQAINNLQLEHYPSATDVANSLIGTLLFISDRENSEFNSIEAYRNIKIDQCNLISAILKDRKSHVLLKLICDIVTNSADLDERTIGNQEARQKLDRLNANISNLGSYRNERLKKINGYAKAILADYGSILLFGHSKLVTNALSEMNDKIRDETQIYICEGRNVAEYNDSNEMIYCDGLEYYRQVSKIGYKKVKLIPDIIVGSLMDHKRISKVIFGANGVDSSSGDFFHTAGHGTIIQLANSHRIPVYVIVDSLKFGNIKDPNNNNRKTKWIAPDERIYPEFPELNSENSCNPREDKIENHKIDALVTDYGIIPPSQLSERIKSGFIKTGDNLFKETAKQGISQIIVE